jgi:hypothetical protein
MARKVIPFTMWKGLRAEFLRANHLIPVPPGWTLDELLDPNAWVHHIGKFSKFDLVEFVEENGAFDVIARVVRVENGQVFFRVLTKVVDSVVVADMQAAAAKTAEDVPEGYKVDRTPRTGWRVTRIADGREIGRNYANRSEAILAATEHAKPETASAAA